MAMSGDAWYSGGTQGTIGRQSGYNQEAIRIQSRGNQDTINQEARRTQSTAINTQSTAINTQSTAIKRLSGASGGHILDHKVGNQDTIRRQLGYNQEAIRIQSGGN
jgi:hypothetical protein